MLKLSVIAAGLVLVATTPAAANFAKFRHYHPVRATLPGLTVVPPSCHGVFYGYGTFRTCVVSNGRTALRACARACSR